MRPDDNQKSKECIFCKIIHKTLPSEKVFESETVYAFRDISPQSAIHILITPKKHFYDVLDVKKDELIIFGELFHAAQQIAGQLGLASNGFRTVFNTGTHACQTIHHLHLHLLGGEQLGGNMTG